METKVEEYDVIIIGAGLSGLSSAYKLHQLLPSIKLIVLEAKDRIGGRTIGKSLKSASGHTSWDLGGQWIGSCQSNISELVKDLGLKVYPQNLIGIKLFQLDKCKLISYNSEIPPLSYFALFEFYFFLRKLNKMVALYSKKDFSKTPLANNWDSTTLHDFMQKSLWSKSIKTSIEACSRCIFGADPKHISLLYFIHYVHSSGGFEQIISSKESFGNQELKIQGGAWQICHMISERIMDNISIKTGTPVIIINQQLGNGKITIIVKDFTEYLCQWVILAIPPNEIVKIQFNPNFNLDRFHVFQRMPISYLTKIIITYKKAFWRDNGFSGEVLSTGNYNKIDQNFMNPLCVVFDANSHNNDPALVAFIGGDQQIQFSSLSERSRKEIVLESLNEYFGFESFEPLDYFEYNWNLESYNGGCPVNVATPGVMLHFKKAFLHPFGRIFFAGTESADTYCGFMDGAVQSGYRAATDIANLIDPTLISKTEEKKIIEESIKKNEHSFQNCDNYKNISKFVCKITVILILSLSLIKCINRF